MPPQVLVGVGLALVLSALTETALGGRAPQAIHGGWTISARHAGVVIGLLALTPVFTSDIAQQRNDAIDAGTAVVLDSRVPNRCSSCTSRSGSRSRLEGERGKVPTIGPAFEPLPERPRRPRRRRPAARRTAGPARPRRDPRLQPLVRPGRADRPAGADPDRPGAEGGPVNAEPARAAPGRRRDRRLARPGRRLPRRGRLLLRAGEDAGPLQAAALAQPGRPAADRRAVLALGARRRRLQARRQPRDAGPGAGHPAVARTLHRALRDRRRRAGARRPRRPAARRRRRRTRRRPQPAARRAAARDAAPDPARPGDRTDQRRPIPARQPAEASSAPPRA